MARHKLLDDLLENETMSIVEIKNTINNNIRLFSNRYGYEMAVSDWENDLEYCLKFAKF